MEHADNIKVRESGQVSRENIAYRLLLVFTAIGAVIAIVTVLAFAFLTYHDPKNAANHLDLCLKLLQGVMSAIGGPIVLSLTLGYLFGRQESRNQSEPSTEDKTSN